MGVIIDTCIWIDLERGRMTPKEIQQKIGNESIYISPVTISEISYSISKAENNSQAIKREVFLEKLLNKPVLVIDEHTGKIFGKVLGLITNRPRQEKHRVQDLWIASQAIQHGFAVFTRNVKDFKDIQGLKVIF